MSITKGVHVPKTPLNSGRVSPRSWLVLLPIPTSCTRASPIRFVFTNRVIWVRHGPRYFETTAPLSTSRSRAGGRSVRGDRMCANGPAGLDLDTFYHHHRRCLSPDHGRHSAQEEYDGFRTAMDMVIPRAEFEGITSEST